ncbi:serine protease Do-like HtrB [Clostridia bacterium]|nr:serine protease Do-like HtrB [Clostridia bacterium]
MDIDINKDNDDEISRIQREIDAKLQQIPDAVPVFMGEGDAPQEVSGSLFDEPFETETKELEEFPEIPNKKPAFYSETIKHENEDSKKQQFRRNLAVAVVATVIGAPLIGFFLGLGYASVKTSGANVAESGGFSFITNETNFTPRPNGEVVSYASAVAAVEPSVVAITALKQNAGEDDNSFFQNPSQNEKTTGGRGSGIIFDTDEKNIYIATNFHVVNGANKVGVSIENSETINASFVGGEKENDLAVISVSKADAAKIGVNNVTVAKFGSSSELVIGDVVFSIGNSLGEGISATMGIVSAVDKNVYISEEGITLHALQTDAPINHGDSGGALINQNGEIVGINTFKYEYYGIEGMGYCIPADDAKPVIERLRNRTPKAFIGITMRNVDKDIAEMYNLPEMGVLVVAVAENSPAQKAGLRENDIITGIDGKSILKKEDVTELVKELSVGKEIEVKLYRPNKGAVTVTVKLGEQPASAAF